MKKLLLIFLFPLTCLAQSPIITGSGIDWTIAPSSALTLSPTPVWRFSAKDNTNAIALGGLVPTLTDSIQGAVMKQLSSSQQATNAGALGLGFWQGQTFYTNFPGLAIGTNWTVVILSMSGDDGRNIGQFSYWGGWSASAMEVTGQALGGTGGISDYNWYSVGGTPSQSTGSIIVTNCWHDAALVMDQSGSAAKFYTNGIVATSLSKDTSNWTVKALGYDNFYHSFRGWWKELIIYTNALSAAQITSVHSYLTNFYGNAQGFTP